MAENKNQYFIEITNEIASRMGRKQDNITLTSIYTRLIMDNRLDYQGMGIGL